MPAIILPKRTWFALLVLAGCAYSNAGILEELEARARSAPSPALDRVIEREELPALALPARAIALPMLKAKVPAVMGRINGVEMPLVLDTGTSAVVLPAEAARDAGLYLPPGEPAAVVGPGHTGTNRLGAFATIEIGGNRLGAGVALVPLDDRPGRWMDLGTERYAIVGCTVLSHFRVTFDFRKGEVRLAPTGLPGSASPLFTEVLVNGKPLLLLVDSGATTVFLEPWAARDLDLISEERAKRHEKRATSLSGALFTHFTLDRVEVAGQAFRDVEAAAVDTFGPWPSKGFRPGGLLGLKGLGDLVWTLDYGTRTLRIEP
jgi:Aspartyl protease